MGTSTALNITPHLMDTSTMQIFQSASLVRVLKRYHYCIEMILARKEIQKAIDKSTPMISKHWLPMLSFRECLITAEQ